MDSNHRTNVIGPRLESVAALLLVLGLCMAPATAQEVLTFDAPQCAGLSGFRLQWNQPVPVAEDGQRVVVDSAVKDRGQTAVWDGKTPGPLAFDAVLRNLLVRFPDAGEKIAQALAKGLVIEKVELVLPYLDEEIWPEGRPDYPGGEGYRYRMNWGVDQLYRTERPNWHAVAYALRKPWLADPRIGPTYNAAINGAVYWERFGAADPTKDRFPTPFGPTEVSSYHPEGRMDVTALVTDPAYGKTLADRLHLLADCGFILSKEELWDERYYTGAYDWGSSCGPRALLIREPSLVVTLKPGPAQEVGPVTPVDVAALAAQHANNPLGAPTAVVPSPAEVAQLNERFLAKPAWMTPEEYARVRQLMGLESQGQVQPFYYRLLPDYVKNRVLQEGARAAQEQKVPFDADYAIYLTWLDWINGRPPRFFEGHLTPANDATLWYNYRDALPAPIQEDLVRDWTAWLMPDRKTAPTEKQRQDFADTSGDLVHPMADDPRVGVDAAGKHAVWGQGDTYYKLTGDWHGNKSFYRSGFTRTMSTENFNSSASMGALLCGQIIGSPYATADGRAGLMAFPFWLWTFSAGVGQEYIDHYYWAITCADNKLFADFCELPEDRMAGWSIINQAIEELAGGYDPNLKKLIGPSSRTHYKHVLGVQDGLYHILNVLSPQGTLNDTDTGVLPALSPNPQRPISAWGQDVPPEMIALESMSGPWADPWISELVDGKPLPWSSLVEKKVVAQGDWVTTYFGVNYGLSSIRLTPQRVHVLGQWRRQAALPSSMRDLGTLDMRVGFNQTQIANDGDGVISQEGFYHTYQYQNKLIMLAHPNAGFLAQQKAVKSLQCTAALFNFEAPAPTWEIFVDGTKVDALPATAKFGQVITVHDGVTYLAIRPLPTDDLGRDTEITLEPGTPQRPVNDDALIQPALLINAYLYNRDAVIGPEASDKLAGCQTGFVVEMGDVNEYGSFEAFQAHIRQTKLTAGPAGAVTYQTGGASLAASWDGFTVNGTDPSAYANKQGLWRDTPLSQMGTGRLEKNGAVLERAPAGGAMLLQTFPKHKIYVATNPLPTYEAYSFTAPGGVHLVADGLCSMGRWAVEDTHAVDLKYCAFAGEYLPPDKHALLASLLFITGTKGQPQVTLNGQDVTGKLKTWKQDGAEGWLVSLTGSFPSDQEITARLAAEKAALATSEGPPMTGA